MTNVVNMNKYPPIYDLYPEFLSLFEGFFCITQRITVKLKGLTPIQYRNQSLISRV